MKFETFVEKIEAEARAVENLEQARLEAIAAEKEVMSELQHALVLAHNREHGSFLEVKDLEFIGFRNDIHAGWRAVYRYVQNEIAIDFEISVDAVLEEQAKLERKSETSIAPLVVLATAIGAAGWYGMRLKQAKMQQAENVRAN